MKRLTEAKLHDRSILYIFIFKYRLNKNRMRLKSTRDKVHGNRIDGINGIDPFSYRMCV